MALTPELSHCGLSSNAALDEQMSLDLGRDCHDYVGGFWMQGPCFSLAYALCGSPRLSEGPYLTQSCAMGPVELSLLLTTTFLTHPSPAELASQECSCLRVFALAVPSS